MILNVEIILDSSGGPAVFPRVLTKWKKNADSVSG